MWKLQIDYVNLWRTLKIFVSYECTLVNAVRMFYGKSSYEMVYMEAIANALDAMATEINVEISAESKKIADTLQVTIGDNGVGFTDGRFKVPRGQIQ